MIAIISVLFGFMTPVFRGSSGHNLSDTADRLVKLINHAQQEAMLSSRVWQLVVDTKADAYHFRRQIPGADFENIEEAPFSGGMLNLSVDFLNLNVNGSKVKDTAEVYLFPTGEQDTFELTLSNGDDRRFVTMGPIGPAEVKSP